MDELISTEKSYVSDLESVIEVIIIRKKYKMVTVMV